MFLACGVGAFSAGIFHVMTHAFFKALLFLGAGSVIHALRGEQDMRTWAASQGDAGHLRHADVRCAGDLPVFPFTSGYFSKDAILVAAYHQHAPWMFWIGVITAGMTAFYVFRAMFLTFFGKYRGTSSSARIAAHHDCPADGACGALACGGFHSRSRISWSRYSRTGARRAGILGYIATAAGLGGILLAYLFYVVKSAARLTRWQRRSAAAIAGFITSTSLMRPMTRWW